MKQVTLRKQFIVTPLLLFLVIFFSQIKKEDNVCKPCDFGCDDLTFAMANAYGNTKHANHD